jgi:hypothetical protein
MHFINQDHDLSSNNSDLSSFFKETESFKINNRQHRDSDNAASKLKHPLSNHLSTCESDVDKSDSSLNTYSDIFDENVDPDECSLKPLKDIWSGMISPGPIVKSQTKSCFISSDYSIMRSQTEPVPLDETPNFNAEGKLMVLI